MSSSVTSPSSQTANTAPSLVLGAIGVVFGDIGTSPLYTLRECLKAAGGISQPNVFGIVSLILWSIIVVVTLKYVSFVMRADNDGEGGILALTALASRVAPARLSQVLLTLGVFGAAMFYGDSMITPAISVISAVEGVTLVDPKLTAWIVPISLVILTGLFKLQKRGTGTVGKVFGPVMIVWFITLAALGLLHIVAGPAIIEAVSPLYAVRFVAHAPGTAFVVLGSVFLALTGGEALYADMGHFGKKPIRLAWLLLVLPSLVLNYFGQGALVLARPATVEQPFFESAPGWALVPLVLLATAATIIASQAVISGAFSMARQCMQLGFLPRMTVRHTSNTEEGQIYVPQINTALAVGVVLLVLAFKTSDNLASAYGIAVTGTFLCTAILAMVVFRRQFHWSRTASVSVFGALFLVDLVFFSANTVKIVEGGWVPLVLGLSLIGMMTSWKQGRDLLLSRWKQSSMPLAPFLARLPQSRIIRVPGLAVFMTGNPDYVPTSLLHNLKHNKVLHENVLFVTVENEDVPEVSQRRRAEVSVLAPGIHRVILRYGFMESPNIPRALEDLNQFGVPFDPMQASYFLGREVLVPGTVPKLPWWRHWLFLVLARNAVPATEFFRIPYDRVVELGVRVAI